MIDLLVAQDTHHVGPGVDAWNGMALEKHHVASELVSLRLRQNQLNPTS